MIDRGHAGAANGADCKSAGLTPFAGSSPAVPMARATTFDAHADDEAPEQLGRDARLAKIATKVREAIDLLERTRGPMYTNSYTEYDAAADEEAAHRRLEEIERLALGGEAARDRETIYDTGEERRR